MEFTNLQFEGIQMGACGKHDLDFLHAAAIEWPELTNLILREQRRQFRTRQAENWPGPAPDPPEQE